MKKELDLIYNRIETLKDLIESKDNRYVNFEYFDTSIKDCKRALEQIQKELEIIGQKLGTNDRIFAETIASLLANQKTPKILQVGGIVLAFTLVIIAAFGIEIKGKYGNSEISTKTNERENKRSRNPD